MTSETGLLSRLVNAVIRGLLRFSGVQLSQQTLGLSGHDDLEQALQLVHRDTHLDKADRDRLGGVLDLGELEVSDIMIHRTSIRGVNADDPPEVAVRTVLESPYTRMPLWRGSTDNIIGVVHAKDLLRALAEPNVEPGNLDIVKIAQKPWFVPDTTNLKDQLAAFLRRKVHFAVVVDEYGEVQGSSRWRTSSRRSSAIFPTNTISRSRVCARKPMARSSSTAACRSVTSTGRLTGFCRTRKRRRSPASSSTSRNPFPKSARPSPSTASASSS